MIYGDRHVPLTNTRRFALKLIRVHRGNRSMYRRITDQKISTISISPVEEKSKKYGVRTFVDTFSEWIVRVTGNILKFH